MPNTIGVPPAPDRRDACPTFVRQPLLQLIENAGINHRRFISLIAAVKFTFVRSYGEISAASRSKSARVLARRFPALVTVNAGVPLSVTTSQPRSRGSQ